MKMTTSALLVGSAASLGMGMYKMFVYDSGEGIGSNPVNAYVGGDAYNYIISGTHSTAFMVLAGALLVSSFLSEIMYTLKESKTVYIDTEVYTVNKAKETPVVSQVQQAKVAKYQHVKGEGLMTWLKKELF